MTKLSKEEKEQIDKEISEAQHKKDLEEYRRRKEKEVEIYGDGSTTSKLLLGGLNLSKQGFKIVKKIVKEVK